MELVAYVGWDWADKKHQLSESDGRQSSSYEVGGSAEELHEWAVRMLERYEGGKVGICIENSKGPVIGALMGYEHLVFYPVNPSSVKSLREAFSPSGKKDDPVDAETLREMVEHHRHKLHVLVPLDEQSRALGFLSEQRRRFVNERTRATNRLRSALKSFFPQALELIVDLDSALGLDFLERWPSLEQLKRSRWTTVERFLIEHNSRSRELNRTRRMLIERARPLSGDPALNEAGRLAVECLVDQLRALTRTIKRYDTKIAAIYESHTERELLDSLPGVGPVIGPRLVAILGSNRRRYDSRETLQNLTGCAPVTSQSGDQSRVYRRIRRSKFLHQTMIEWANQAYRRSEWAGRYYHRQRDKGKKHFTAIRALAFKLIRILYHCWSEDVLYDDAVHAQNLQRHGSPHAAAA